MISAGITGFTPQQPVQLLTGPIRVDLGDKRRRMALEGDSYTFHGSPDAFLKDCERYNELVRIDWLVLRFGYGHVTLQASWVAATVRDTCLLRDRPQHGSA